MSEIVDLDEAAPDARVALREAIRRVMVIARSTKETEPIRPRDAELLLAVALDARAKLVPNPKVHPEQQ